MNDFCDTVRTGTVIGVSGNTVIVKVDGIVSKYDVPRGNIVPQIGQEVFVDVVEKVVISSPKFSRMPGEVYEEVATTTSSSIPPYFPFAVARGNASAGTSYVYFYFPYVDHGGKSVKITYVRFTAGYTYSSPKNTYSFFTGRPFLRKKSDGRWIAVASFETPSPSNPKYAENRVIDIDYPMYLTSPSANNNTYRWYVDFVNGWGGVVEIADTSGDCPAPDDEDGFIVPPLGTGALDGKFSALKQYNFDDLYSVFMGPWNGIDSDVGHIVSRLSVDVSSEVVKIIGTDTEVYRESYECDTNSSTDLYIYNYPQLQYDYASIMSPGSIISRGRFSSQFTDPEVVSQDVLLSLSECDCSVSTKLVTIHNYDSGKWDRLADINDPNNYKLKYGISCCGMSYVEGSTSKLFYDMGIGYTYIGSIGGRYDVWYKYGEASYVFAGNDRIVHVYVGANIRDKLRVQHTYHHIAQVETYDNELYWVDDGYTVAPVVFDAGFIDTFDAGVVSVVNDDARIVYGNVTKSPSAVDAKSSVSFKWPGADGASTAYPLISYTRDGSDYHTFVELPKPYDLIGPSQYFANMFVLYGEHGHVDGFVSSVIEFQNHKFTVYLSNSMHSGSAASFGANVAVGYKLYGDMLY